MTKKDIFQVILYVETSAALELAVKAESQGRATLAEHILNKTIAREEQLYWDFAFSEAFAGINPSPKDDDNDCDSE